MEESWGLDVEEPIFTDGAPVRKEVTTDAIPLPGGNSANGPNPHSEPAWSDELSDVMLAPFEGSSLPSPETHNIIAEVLVPAGGTGMRKNDGA